MKFMFVSRRECSPKSLLVGVSQGTPAADSAINQVPPVDDSLKPKSILKGVMRKPAQADVVRKQNSGIGRVRFNLDRNSIKTVERYIRPEGPNPLRELNEAYDAIILVKNTCRENVGANSHSAEKYQLMTGKSFVDYSGSNELKSAMYSAHLLCDQSKLLLDEAQKVMGTHPDVGVRAAQCSKAGVSVATELSAGVRLLYEAVVDHDSTSGNMVPSMEVSSASGTLRYNYRNAVKLYNDLERCCQAKREADHIFNVETVLQEANQLLDLSKQAYVSFRDAKLKVFDKGTSFEI